MFLTEAEVAELTKRTRVSAQRRALERMGIVFLVDPDDGHPRVLRSHVERLAGAEPGATMRPDVDPPLYA